MAYSKKILHLNFFTLYFWDNVELFIYDTSSFIKLETSDDAMKTAENLT